MPLDVIALQYLYGPNLSTNAGDSQFNLQQTDAYLTIWDASGNDVVSAGGSNAGWAIALPRIQISDIASTLTGHTVPISELNLSAPKTLTWLIGNIEGAVGSAFADQIEGNDLGNRIFGGAGVDTIVGGDAVNYLRGEDGADRILGGSGFDDIVYGSLGADTCSGGDIVRGGQDNDTISGDGGNDWLSGDRGDDTISGGLGADIFHTFGEAGLDRVLDFNRAEGDRVQLDSGTTYSLQQAGSDVLVAMDGGGQMVLVGVTLASLSGDWIFGA